MNVRVRSFFVIIGVGMLICGCDKIKNIGLAPQPVTSGSSAVQETAVVRGTVIAKVNNLPITLEELNQEVEAYNSSLPEENPEARITTRDQKISYLKEQMVRTLLLYQTALDKRLDSDDTVTRILERTKRELLVMQLLRQETEKINVSSEEIEAYYDQYKDRLKQPEERRIREILVNSESDAKDVLIQLLQGADFSTLARERSRAESAREGGNLGFIKPGDKSPAFDKSAFADTLEEGQVSNIFRLPVGFAVIKVEEIKGGKPLTITEVWDDIKMTLMFLKQQQRIEELVSGLSNNARVEIYESEVQ